MFDGLNDRLRKLLVIKKKNANLEKKLAECKKCIAKLEVYRDKEQEMRVQLESETQLVTEICQLIEVSDKSQVIEKLKEMKGRDGAFIEELCSVLCCSREEIIAVVTSLKRFESENQTLLKKLTKLEGKIMSVVGASSVDEALEKLRLVQFQSVSVSDETAELQKKVVHLKAKVKDVKAKSEETSMELKMCSMELNTLKRQESEKNETIARLQSEREQMNIEMRRLQATKEKLEKKVGKLESKSGSEAEEVKTKYESKISDLKKKHEAMKDEVEELKMKLEVANKKGRRVKELEGLVGELKRHFNANGDDELMLKAREATERVSTIGTFELSKEEPLGQQEELDTILPHKDTPQLVENAIEDWTRQVTLTAETLKSTQEQLKQCKVHEAAMGQLLGSQDPKTIRSQSLAAIRIGMDTCKALSVDLDTDAVEHELEVLQKVFKLSNTKTMKGLHDRLKSDESRNNEMKALLSADDTDMLVKLREVVEHNKATDAKLKKVNENYEAAKDEMESTKSALKDTKKKLDEVCDLFGVTSSTPMSEIENTVKKLETKAKDSAVLSDVMKRLGATTENYRETIDELLEKQKLYDRVKKLSRAPGENVIDNLQKETEVVRALCDDLQITDYETLEKHVLGMRDASAILATVYQQLIENGNFNGAADELKTKSEKLKKLVKPKDDEEVTSVIKGLTDRARAFEAIKSEVCSNGVRVRKADDVVEIVHDMSQREEKLCALFKCGKDELLENVAKEHNFVSRVTQGKALKEIMKEIEQQNETLARLLQIHGMSDANSLCSLVQNEKRKLEELSELLSDVFGSSDTDEVRGKLKKLKDDSKSLTASDNLIDSLCSTAGVDRESLPQTVRELVGLSKFLSEQLDMPKGRANAEELKEALSQHMKDADKMKEKQDKYSKMAASLLDGSADEATIGTALEQSKSVMKQNEKLKTNVEKLEQENEEMKQQLKQLAKTLKLSNVPFEQMLEKASDLVESRKKLKEEDAQLKEQIMDLTGSANSDSALTAIKSHQKVVSDLCGITKSANIEEAIDRVRTDQKSLKETREKLGGTEKENQRLKREILSVKGDLEKQSALTAQLKTQIEKHKESTTDLQKQVASSKHTNKEMFRVIGGATDTETAIIKVTEMKRRITELESELVGAKFTKSITSAFESMSHKDQEFLKQIQTLMQRQTQAFMTMISKVKGELQRRNVNREQLIAILKRAEIENAKLLELIDPQLRVTPSPIPDQQSTNELFAKVLPGPSKPKEGRCSKTLL